VPESIPLSRSVERALASQMIQAAAPAPLSILGAAAAVLLVEVLDAVSWAVLDQAGLDRDSARAVLAAMWADR